MPKVAVIDYQMGNLHSMAKALERVAPRACIVVTSSPQEIKQADRVVFPGVGALADCMQALDTLGLRESVVRAAQEKPFLGVCLGLQALFEWSEEGETEGLGILPGKIVRFPRDHRSRRGERLKVPHMGWNRVFPIREHPLWEGIPAGSWFYFVHSYYALPEKAATILATCEYGFDWTAATGGDNLFAVQFHPEKSQCVGLKLLENFINWNP